MVSENFLSFFWFLLCNAILVIPESVNTMQIFHEVELLSKLLLVSIYT